MWFGTELTFLTNLSRVPEQTGQISGSSAPNILPSRVQIPDTSSTLLSFLHRFHLLSNLCYFCRVKRTKINKKRPGLAYFLKTKLVGCSPYNDQMHPAHLTNEQSIYLLKHPIIILHRIATPPAMRRCTTVATFTFASARVTSATVPARTSRASRASRLSSQRR